jgi:hypothetical protein
MLLRLLSRPGATTLSARNPDRVVSQGTPDAAFSRRFHPRRRFPPLVLASAESGPATTGEIDALFPASQTGHLHDHVCGQPSV